MMILFLHGAVECPGILSVHGVIEPLLEIAIAYKVAINPPWTVLLSTTLPLPTFISHSNNHQICLNQKDP